MLTGSACLRRALEARPREHTTYAPNASAGAVANTTRALMSILRLAEARSTTGVAAARCTLTPGGTSAPSTSSVVALVARRNSSSEKSSAATRVVTRARASSKTTAAPAAFIPSAPSSRATLALPSPCAYRRHRSSSSSGEPSVTLKLAVSASSKRRLGAPYPIKRTEPADTLLARANALLSDELETMEASNEATCMCTLAATLACDSTTLTLSSVSPIAFATASRAHPRVTPSGRATLANAYSTKTAAWGVNPPTPPADGDRYSLPGGGCVGSDPKSRWLGARSAAGGGGDGVNVRSGGGRGAPLKRAPSRASTVPYGVLSSGARTKPSGGLMFVASVLCVNGGSFQTAGGGGLGGRCVSCGGGGRAFGDGGAGGGGCGGGDRVPFGGGGCGFGGCGGDGGDGGGDGGDGGDGGLGGGDGGEGGCGGGDGGDGGDGGCGGGEGGCGGDGGSGGGDGDGGGCGGDGGDGGGCGGGDGDGGCGGGDGGDGDGDGCGGGKGGREICGGGGRGDGKLGTGGGNVRNGGGGEGGMRGPVGGGGVGESARAEQFAFGLPICRSKMTLAGSATAYASSELTKPQYGRDPFPPAPTDKSWSAEGAVNNNPSENAPSTNRSARAPSNLSETSDHEVLSCASAARGSTAVSSTIARSVAPPTAARPPPIHPRFCFDRATRRLDHDHIGRRTCGEARVRAPGRPI